MSPRHNFLLAPLPDEEYRLFLPHLQLVSLLRGQVLFDWGEALHWVYYPVGAVISLLIQTPPNETQEVLMLGKHCMVGVGALLGASPYRARVLSSGLAYRMPMARLQGLRDRCPNFQLQGAWAMQRVLVNLSLNALCCRRHTLPQHLRRWLLTHLDLCDDHTVRITHDELAEKLGYRREMVTHSLGELVRAGTVVLQRGSITVVRREDLLHGVCDCYRQQSQWLMPASTKPGSG